MTNNAPFQILLDMNDQECFRLFCVIKSLFNYPSIDNGSDFDDFNGKLYAAAFSFICSEYLIEFAHMYPHEDFEGFVDDMNFKEDIEDLDQLANTYSVKKYDDFEDLMHAVISSVRATITQDIKSVFQTEQLQLRLFGSVFNMDETEAYMPFSDNYHTVAFLH